MKGACQEIKGGNWCILRKAWTRKLTIFLNIRKPGKYCWNLLQVIWQVLQREDYSHGGSFYGSAVIRRGGFQVLNENNEVLSENI